MWAGELASTSELPRVHLRGCPGMGTRWAARVIPCLFAHPVQVIDTNKHTECRLRNYVNFDASKLLVSDCTAKGNCTHAVIARHPMSLKQGRAQAEWEAYYGGWMRHKNKNVIFLRFETLVQQGCTRPFAKRSVAERANALERAVHFKPMNQTIWAFWNYSFESIGDSTKIRKSLMTH